jgi:MerR family mercuric resistance operon transcriptional regulator/MerR family gold-responsive transcriptional activator of gol and ges genes
MAAGLTIGQLAKEVGVNVQTIRYYERLNLFPPSVRKPSGYRLYGTSESQRLHFIKNAQSLGFTLNEIRELLNLRVSSAARCGDVQQKAEDKLRQVEAKVQDLQALARALRSLIHSCKAGQPTERCPILKSLEEKRRSANGNREARG